MSENMFDKVIAELAWLEAQIAAINSRPFMPETPTQISIRMRDIASRNSKAAQAGASVKRRKVAKKERAQ